MIAASNPYGTEFILDLHGCNVALFNRNSIKDFLRQLAKEIDMEPCELYFWDDEGLPPAECQTAPHLKGTSAIQFILTSNITIHTLDLLGKVFINVFSCKEFNPEVVVAFSAKWFGGRVVNQTLVKRM